MKGKYLVGIALVTMTFSVSLDAAAQEKKTKVGKAIQKTGKAAESVGNKTAEVAVKGSAKVVDAKYKGRMAPDGSNVYIDGKKRTYYINSKGARIYLKPTEIRVRPKS